MGLNRPAVEVRILFKCQQKPMSRTDIATAFHRFSISERDTALNNLIDDGLLELREMPKPKAKKTPVFYFISEAGK